jgi:hypothetical protein
VYVVINRFYPKTGTSEFDEHLLTQLVALALVKEKGIKPKRKPYPLRRTEPLLY